MGTKKKAKGDKKKSKLDKARAKLASGKTKEKCCQSKPRCISCPTVRHRLRKLDAKPAALSDDELANLLDKIRAW